MRQVKALYISVRWKISLLCSKTCTKSVNVFAIVIENLIHSRKRIPQWSTPNNGKVRFPPTPVRRFHGVIVQLVRIPVLHDLIIVPFKNQFMLIRIPFQKSWMTLKKNWRRRFECYHIYVEKDSKSEPNEFPQWAQSLGVIPWHQSLK
jgi:hypothetical protein